MQFFRSLAELFPRFARRSGALERAVRPSLQSRRLRLEPLENRELLAVDAFAVPFGPLPLENVANEAAPVVVSASVLADDGATLSVRTETAEPVAPPSFEQLMESLGQIKIESLDSETDVASSFDSEEAQNELQPSFIVDGVEYYPLSQAVARRVVFEDSGVDVASLDEPFVIVPNANDGETGVYNAQSGGSGGETSVWTLNFSGGVSNSNNENPLGALTSLGIENALLERATSVSGGAAVDASLPVNFLKVTLPALPDYYEAEVVFTGTAALGVDYEIHAPLNIFNHYYNNSCFTYSGGSSQFFVLPINDAQPEALEDFTAILEQPTPTVDSGGSSYAQSYDFIFESSSVTATFVDDDHWKVSVEASDSTATERLADVEQDYGYYTFKREHQNPDVAAKIDAKIQELTEADATDAELDAVKELADLVTGDATYSVRVEFEAYYNPESNLDAALGDDYSLSTTPLVSENADAYLASFTAITSTIQTAPALARREYDGVIPASKMEALLRLNPVFDWEDEGELFDPNCLINQSPAATTPDQDDSPAATTPDKQTGEKARLRLLNATWSGQGADYNPLAEPTTAAVEIKDGAIAELYFDYDGDGTLDPYQSTADETCYVPLNNDDDNLNGVEDREESAAVANENDLPKFVVVAWLAEPGNHTLEASVTVGGNNVEFWQNDAGTLPLEPLGAEGDPVKVIDSTAGTDYHFWGVCEGAFGGAASANLEVKLDDGNPATSPIVHNDNASLKTTSYWLDLDVDSDNNGYINDDDDALEDTRGRSIVFFPSGTNPPDDYKKVEVRFNWSELDGDINDYRIRVSTPRGIEIRSDSASTLTFPQNDATKTFAPTDKNREFYAVATASNASSLAPVRVTLEKKDDANNWIPVASDTIAFDVQNSNNASDWIVPSGWRIGEDGSLTTYAIQKGAVGPLKPGSSITEKEGCAYSRQAFTDGFTLSFNYEFLHNEDYSEATKDGNYGYVQRDSNKDGEIIKDGEESEKPVDEQKLSFVGNSGVKIGGASGVPEVAILDFCAMVDMVGNGDKDAGIAEIAKSLVEHKGTSIGNTTGNLLYYKEEELFKLLHGVKYGDATLANFAPNTNYNKLLDDALKSLGSSAQETQQLAFEEFLNEYYNLCNNSNGMRIEFDNSRLKVYLKQKNVAIPDILIYEANGISVGDKRLYLQTHHGSGVRFSNVQLTLN